MEDKLEQELTLDEKAKNKFEEDLLQWKIWDLAWILGAMADAKAEYDWKMNDLKEKYEKVKTRTTRWYDYEEDKAEKRSRNCECRVCDCCR